jgi:hypothetical protein
MSRQKERRYGVVTSWMPTWGWFRDNPAIPADKPVVRMHVRMLHEPDREVEIIMPADKARMIAHYLVRMADMADESERAK